MIHETTLSLISCDLADRVTVRVERDNAAHCQALTDKLGWWLGLFRSAILTLAD
jgi:hypothetical protein